MKELNDSQNCEIKKIIRLHTKRYALMNKENVNLPSYDRLLNFRYFFGNEK